MTDYYQQFHPKPRTGKECKKVNCVRYEDYKAWNQGSESLKFCMQCKHSSLSQYKSIKEV